MPHDAVQPDPSPESSRAATKGPLLDLRTRGSHPTAWAQFAADATTRSIQQAAQHRMALAQTTTLHGLFLIIGSGSRRRWVANQLDPDRTPPGNA